MIEDCIEEVVREALEKNEDVTVNLVRSRVEEKLGLDPAFLKSDAQWKQRSKRLISAAFNESSPREATKKSAKAPREKPAPKIGSKRKSEESQASRKKQKKGVAIDSDVRGSGGTLDKLDNNETNHIASRPKQHPKSGDGSALSDPPEDDAVTKTDHENGRGTNDDEESELSSVIDEPAPKSKRQKKAAQKAESASKATKARKPARKEPAVVDDESDLSEVFDDPAPKKGRKKKSTSPGAASRPKSKTSAAKNLSPDEEEIKRLQSWLLKCGIRKLWHRELAPFDTNKEKIKHLKSMLENAGMTGRFSAEKASQIKEARELKAELEAATEFNKTWGHEEDGSGEEKDEGELGDGDVVVKSLAHGKRARPKGFVDFGDSDEESE